MRLCGCLSRSPPKRNEVVALPLECLNLPEDLAKTRLGRGYYSTLYYTYVRRMLCYDRFGSHIPTPLSKNRLIALLFLLSLSLSAVRAGMAGTSQHRAGSINSTGL